MQQLSAAAAEEACAPAKWRCWPSRASGTVVYRYDDTNPEGRTARTAGGSRRPARRRPDGSRGADDRLMREPGSRYIDFLIPGLLGMNLMGSAIWGMGFAIVDARRKKLMKRLVATPMPRHYYLLSFVLSRLAMLVIEVGLLVGFGALVFKVPVRGSLVGAGRTVRAGSLSFSALGLLIASRAKTIEAASGLMNLVMMPMWICSARVLLRAAISGRDAARDQSAAADRRDRRACARTCCRRAGAWRNSCIGRNHPRSLVGGVLRAGGTVVPLEVGCERTLLIDQDGRRCLRFLFRSGEDTASLSRSG